MLRDKVETQFADDEQRESSQALPAGAHAFGRVVPDQGKVADGSLGPAWWNVSFVMLDSDAVVEHTLCPSHPLLPESAKGVGSHLV